MPTYTYKAITANGQEVRNKVEDSSRFSLIKKLKRNNLMPITVTQVNLSRRQSAKKRKNINDMGDRLKNVTIKDVTALRKKQTFKEKMFSNVSVTEKIRPRDVMVFTQNFYLLKKSNFNNVHALSTIIESTENLSFRSVLEDILSGVEAR